MPMTDERIKNYLTFDNFKKLFIYFIEHSESLCDCCKNNIECKGKECPCYETFHEGRDKDGNIYYWSQEISCMDLNFGDCELYDGTKCYDCIHSETGYDEFDWNGEIKG